MTTALTNKDLIAQLEAIGAQIGREVPKSLAKQGRAKIESLMTAWTFELEALQPKVEKPKEKKAKEPKAKKVTIKQIACDKLAKVLYTNEDGRTVGASYQSIIEEILEENPTVNTSIACLRWYANKIRGDFAGYEAWKLPQLRERPASEATEEA